ncbi:MAG: prepilin-type N-terminal cleavage/methylation domain-containing protein, partial [Oscillospiraceae bacterium]|nr:prepilin-type N-terminal cleavage/methylation domain-containing protein [Oscillospiraceae bacterium]
MKPLRKHKGISLIETLIVLLILALVMTLISVAVIKYIGDAQKTAATANARTVYVTAQGVLAM